MYYLTKFCCFCLNERSNLINLNIKNFKSVNILNKLSSCFNNNFDIENIPAFICLECCIKLEATYEFKRTCLGNFNRVQSYIRELKNINPDCESKYQFNEINILISDIKFKIKSELENLDRNVCDEGKQELVTAADSEETETVENTVINNKNLKSFEEHLDIILMEERVETNEELEANKDLPKTSEKLDENKMLGKFDVLLIKTENPDYSEWDEEQNIVENPFQVKVPVKNEVCENNELQKQCSNEESNLLMHKEEMLEDTCIAELEPPPVTLLEGAYHQYLEPSESGKSSDATKNPHFCSTCGKCFLRMSELKRHVIMHTGERPHSCSICEQRFTRKSSLNRHMMEHSNQRPYCCSLCGSSFKQKCNLNQHMLRRHNDERPHCCSICEESFASKGDLKQHVLRYHSDQTLYSCPVCQRCFTKKFYLKNHMVIHGNERPHTCSMCGKSFKVRGTLTNHILSYHSEQRPFSCSICGSSFKRKSILSLHILRRHSDERLHPCTICGESFTENDNLNQHVTHYHSDQQPHPQEQKYETII